MGANESSLEGDAMAQEADDSSSSLSATGAASAYDAPPEPPEAEAPAEAATSPGDEPPELLCPITLSMMGDPVVANDGHSYERAAIATWLATHDTSPRTREPMGGANLVPNHALRAQIGEWRAARGLPAMPERRRGLAPAHVAAERGKARALAALLRAGADPALPQRGGCHETCVHLASAPQAPRALRALLDVVGRAPAVVDARTTDGSTPLHLAAAVGSREATEALLDAGADATARTLDGDSPLHVAAWTNALPVAEALLARGAEVDAVKRDGSTPLHLCASRGLYGMVTILLEAGADKRKTTVSGSTPADRAALFRDDRLVRSLS
ncbi:hypothetical protein SO694_00006271 [Aureococcus anophagefferens]|uniref:U-box domain-containing protein n=3 Tax=Aureococcus anophagefferens TaxID=44056 RepID=A0ABR1GA54_AURAN